MVGVSADKPDDESCNEPFSLEMACELIGATKQKEGVKVLQQVVEEEEEWDVDKLFLGVFTLFPDIFKLVILFSNRTLLHIHLN